MEKPAKCLKNKGCSKPVQELAGLPPGHVLAALTVQAIDQDTCIMLGLKLKHQAGWVYCRVADLLVVAAPLHSQMAGKDRGRGGGGGGGGRGGQLLPGHQRSVLKQDTNQTGTVSQSEHPWNRLPNYA